MATKVIVTYSGHHTREKVEQVRQRVADALSICLEDVLCLPDMTVTVIEVPDSKAREKADPRPAPPAEPKKPDHK
jgi:hypothetical protein